MVPEERGAFASRVGGLLLRYLSFRSEEGFFAAHRRVGSAEAGYWPAPFVFVGRTRWFPQWPDRGSARIKGSARGKTPVSELESHLQSALPGRRKQRTGVDEIQTRR